MKIKSAIAAMAAALGAVTASADTYVFDAALSGQDNVDWTVKESYSGTYARNPAADDTVEIPAGVTAKVTAGSASWTLINTLTRIVPRDGAVFEVDVPAAYEGRALLAVPVSEFGLDNAVNCGTLRKTGGGVLELTSYGKVMDEEIVKDYYVNVAVNGGDLHLYAGATTKEKFYFQEVSVAEGATLHICYVGYSYFTGLNGEGFVTLDNTEAEQNIYLIGSGTSSYGGWMTGKIRIDMTAGRHDITCKTNTINTICPTETAVCGFTRLGNSNSAGAQSSLGSGNFNLAKSAGIIYLGDEEETSSKTLWISINSFIDAGTYGGLTLSGKIDSSGSSESLRTFTLRGDNANVCTISGTFPGKANQKNVFYLRKTGTGTWYLRSNATRGSLGVIDVENGTLQFNTIAEKGYPCSFGYATNLFQQAVNIAYDRGTRVNYAFVLGGDGTVGTLEYIGSKEGKCSTRPIAIRSEGRLISDSKAIWLGDIYALGNGERTLKLAGNADKNNRVAGLSDGKDGGRLNVVKEGTGTWMLQGTNAITGSLVSKGGHLAVWNPEKRYTWFRFTAKENGYGCPTYDTTYSVGTNANGSAKTISDTEKGYLQISEIAVYDEDGNNIAAGITEDSENLSRLESNGYFGLQPGQVCLGRGMKRLVNGDNDFNHLFDKNNKVLQAGFSDAYTNGMVRTDESTWVPIVFRLPASVTTTAVAMDVMSGRNRACTVASYGGRNLISFRFEGSTDGLHWDMLFDDKDGLEIPETQPHWYAEPTSNTYGARIGGGFAFDDDLEPNSYASHSFAAVGAANGGIFEVIGEPLTISGLEIDASAPAGVMSNIVFAAEGTVNVVNADVPGGAALELPGDYSELDGFANLSGWHVSLDGEGSASKSIGIKDGKLMLLPIGFRFILR